MFLARTAYLLALFLAGVFVFAGTMKLRDRTATTRTFRDMGLPCPRIMAIAVPILEIALSIGLAVLPAWGGPAAMVVLAFFTTMLVGQLRSGTAVNCGCFGQASMGPLTPTDIYRNVAFMAGAALASFAVPSLPGPLSLAAAAAAVGLASLLVSRTRSFQGAQTLLS